MNFSSNNYINKLFITNHLKKKGAKQKLENFLTISSELKERKVICEGFPLWLTVDPTNICTLGCPFCPTGTGGIKRAKGKMDMENFKKIIDILGPYLLHIDMQNWGEPLLHEDIYQMISYAKKFDIHMTLSTNFQSFFDERKAEEMIGSGLDRLIVSIDGASQETYEKYRRGGNFYKAIENIKTLVKKKKEIRSSSPAIIWQFLVFRHNEHEIEIARKKGKELGVDDVGITPAYIAADSEEYRDWVPLTPKYSKYNLEQKPETISGSEDFLKAPTEKICNWLWLGITINWDGTVASCCGIDREEDDFGDFFAQRDFLQLWNNSFYMAARDFMKKRESSDQELRREMKNVCVNCPKIGQINLNFGPGPDFWIGG